MGARDVEQGPTGKRVRENVRALRDLRKLTGAQLAERMADVGRPVQATAINKIELGSRRVDVDDLMALALALDCTPNRLLLPAPDSDEEPVALTDGQAVQSASSAWRWAVGEALLGVPEGSMVDALRRHVAENQPRPKAAYALPALVEQHRDVLAPIARAVRDAREAGLTTEQLREFIRYAAAFDELGS